MDVKRSAIAAYAIALGLFGPGCGQQVSPHESLSLEILFHSEDILNRDTEVEIEAVAQPEIAWPAESGPEIAESSPCQLQDFCRDADADGYPILDCEAACEQPEGYIPRPLTWLGDCNDEDPKVHPLRAEICDSIDNDCNGVVDDNIASEVCYAQSDFGICMGKLSCTGGLLNCDAPMAMEEICDGLDNNCNQLIDEGLESYPCTNSNEFGVCPGEESCIEGQLVCDAPTAQVEICDGLDNNCNEHVDDIEVGCCEGGIIVIEVCPTSDIIFVIDATSSMATTIEAVKDGVTKVAEKIVEGSYPSRLGLITFNDFGYWDPNNPPTSNYGFASSPDEFKDWVESIEVSGGGDEPETQLPAIVEALSFDWGAGHLRKMVLITDATFHQNDAASPYNITQVKHLLTASFVSIIGVMCGDLIEDVVTLTEGIGVSYEVGEIGDVTALYEYIVDELNLKVWAYCDENLEWIMESSDCTL
jgi:hypothetical protein